MVMWAMSDRAIPRSYRMMEGFGVHTFRLVNADGQTRLVKFHWKPVLGVHSLVWDEAQKIAGVDPDFHRRDLYHAIEAGRVPRVGARPAGDARQRGPDVRGLRPARRDEDRARGARAGAPIGKMTLDRNPTNFFAETEQVAFHVGQPGAGHRRHRRPAAAGPAVLVPRHAAHAARRPELRADADQPAARCPSTTGFMQQGVHAGRTPYLPNSVGGGCPFMATAQQGAYVHHPRPVAGPKVRQRPLDDPYTQATMFWRSMTEVEQDHIVDAFTFELGHVEVPAVVERMLTRLTAVDGELARRVSVGLGMPAEARPDGGIGIGIAPPGEGGAGPLIESPALAMISTQAYPVDGRVVQILAGHGADLAGIRSVRDTLMGGAAVPHVVAAHKGAILGRRRGDELTVDRSFHTASPAEFDALVIAHGAGLAAVPVAIEWVRTAYRHLKPIAVWGDGTELLAAAGIAPDAPGVIVVDKVGKRFVADLTAAMAMHRVWDRLAPHPTRDPQEVSS
jgi:catalase